MKALTTCLLTGAFLAMSFACRATAPRAVVKKVAPVTALALAQNGKTNYSIVIGSAAIPAERTAARELSDYLYQISGARFEVKNEGAVSTTAPQILVGQGARVKTLLPRQDWASLGAAGIVIKTTVKNLVLVGGRPRGSLYAVYSLARRHRGRLSGSVLYGA